MSKQATAQDLGAASSVREDEEPMVENPRMGLVETSITHPLRHLLSPGMGNKAEAVFSLGGRVGAGYLGYLGVKTLIAYFRR